MGWRQAQCIPSPCSVPLRVLRTRPSVCVAVSVRAMQHSVHALARRRRAMWQAAAWKPGPVSTAARTTSTWAAAAILILTARRQRLLAKTGGVPHRALAQSTIHAVRGLVKAFASPRKVPAHALVGSRARLASRWCPHLWLATKKRVQQTQTVSERCPTAASATTRTSKLVLTALSLWRHQTKSGRRQTICLFPSLRGVLLLDSRQWQLIEACKRAPHASAPQNAQPVVASKRNALS